MTPRKPLRFRQCVGCGCDYQIKNTLSQYCTKACRERIWAAARPGYMVEAQRRYLSNPEKAAIRRERMRRYNQRPEVVARRSELNRAKWALRAEEYRGRSRARRDGFKRMHTAAEWREKVAQYGGRCAYCGAKPRILTKDHIIPISRGDPLTVDRIENIIPACFSCNSRKNNGPPLVHQKVLL